MGFTCLFAYLADLCYFPICVTTILFSGVFHNRYFFQQLAGPTNETAYMAAGVGYGSFGSNASMDTIWVSAIPTTIDTVNATLDLVSPYY